MRFVDLEPRYFCLVENGPAVGLTFNCPHCPDSGIRLAIATHLDGTKFDPDPDNAQQIPAGEFVWDIVSGDNFDNITLSPSVDASGTGHWHGFVKDGGIN